MGIFEIDISDAVPRIRAANRRAEATYGWSSDELASLDAAQLIPDEPRPDPAHGRVCGPARPPSSETTNRRRDGTLFPVRIIATPARAQRGLRDCGGGGHHRAAAAPLGGWRPSTRSAGASLQEVHDGVAQDIPRCA
ncbi:MAG: PAS domain S-box protein [Kouleothrix sp.]|nr:PAS domain S-box protein [Kouleothrix sp.]